ncbi:hypothetical protein K227x_25720 [Rubripirellula lacrimiformis]|uniref:Uncharacterized protein n=1 Tax=Rubripirellula lacrimiformis TaxID=1930273 RepID=A0A517NAM3_9BACT|nr:hypothetical protein [Rubripirellula lacrimiformis]QDT04183.1 hypothetical protein K227x_25720 [Rubripirellula lacrimiformis]
MSNISHRTESLRPRLVQTWSIAVLMIAALPLGGCRICADCEDLAYPAYGGAWQRTNRDSGRVGSVFDPGGAKMAALTNRDEPDHPDEIIRERQQLKKQQRGDDGDMQENENWDEDGPNTDDEEPRRPYLRDRTLDDIETPNEDTLRQKSLDDIEVRIIPGRAPVMVNQQN